MNKFVLQNRMHDYLDGELSPTERSEMDQALLEHPDIIAEIEQFQQQREHMLNTGMASAPKSLLDNILLEVADTSTVANQPRSKSYMAYAVVAIAGLFAWVAIPTSQSPIVEPSVELKGAQVLPSINPIQLPTTSPIEEANKHLEDLRMQSIQREVPTTTTSSNTSSTTHSTKSHSKKTASKKSNTTFVIQTPDTPYVPEWEDKHVIKVTEDAFDNDAFQFRSAPAKLLFTLNNLVTQVGGSLKSTNGVQFSPVELTNFSPRVQCEMWVPTESVANINERLTELGGQFFATSIRQEDGFGVFKIDVRYEYY